MRRCSTQTRRSKIPPPDTTPAHTSMRVHAMLENQMHLVRPLEMTAVIQAAQLVVTADDEYAADDSDQYPHAVMVAVDLLRERIAKLVGEGDGN